MHFLKRLLISILTWEARLTLARRRPKIIAITGSIGKTTTKDAIFAALLGEIRARKSAKSFNNELGIPLTILGLENPWKSPIKWIGAIVSGLLTALGAGEYPTWLVIEVGADRPGDIRRVAKWLRPDIAVLTAVPETPVHVEYFESPEAVLLEKRSLAEHVRPGGTIVLNGDDERVRSVKNDFRSMSITFGFDSSNDFHASHEILVYEGMAPVGMQFRVNHDGSSIPVTLMGTVGSPRVYAAAAAFAVADVIGIDAISAAKGLNDWTPPPGRVRILKGVRGSVIIDDTYNSSPAAALAALDILKSVKAVHRIAILGDMLELGKYSSEAHKKLGIRAAECCDMLVTLGFRARATAEAARDAGMTDANVRVYEQNEAERAGEELLEEIGEGDIVLVKGSQSMRMERTVLALMAEPERASELLVRMDPDWQMR